MSVFDQIEFADRLKMGPPFISSFSPLSFGSQLAILLNDATASYGESVAWSSTAAIYIPFMLPGPATAYEIVVRNGTAAGNLDAGIYDNDGNRLVSNGSVAAVSADTQVFNIADTDLEPGWYYMAVSCSNNSHIFRGVELSSVFYFTSAGVQYQTGVGASLPATWAPTAGGALVVPQMGVAFKSDWLFT